MRVSYTDYEGNEERTSSVSEGTEGVGCKACKVGTTIIGR